MDWRTIPPLTALRAFAAAAEHKSLTRAGEALFVTQAAISQQIKILENHLGTKLILRNARGISLTTNGEYLALGLSSAFSEISVTIQNLSEAEASRPLVISTTPMLASGFLMQRLSGFLEKNPEVELHVETSIDVINLQKHSTDMAIRYGTGIWSGVHSELLIPGRLTVVAARSLIGDRRFTHPRELLEFPILQEFAAVEFDLWLENSGVPTTAKKNVLRVPGNMLLDGIKRGDGIGATVPAFISDELRSGELIALFDDPVPDIGYYLVTMVDTNHPSIQALKNWLKKSANIIAPADTSSCISWRNDESVETYSLDYSGDILKLSKANSKEKYPQDHPNSTQQVNLLQQ
jgi:LysR family glycine cleavage system transcriptional activator